MMQLFLLKINSIPYGDFMIYILTLADLNSQKHISLHVFNESGSKPQFYNMWIYC